MTSTLRKIEAARRLAASTDVPGEKDAAHAAIARLEANSTTTDVVRRRETLPFPADPFTHGGARSNSGPRPVRLLLPHQRQAWLALAAGGGRLSRTENSFLHRMRESRYISPDQQRWLNEIGVRLEWEASR